MKKVTPSATSSRNATAENTAQPLENRPEQGGTAAPGPVFPRVDTADDDRPRAAQVRSIQVPINEMAPSAAERRSPGLSPSQPRQAQGPHAAKTFQRATKSLDEETLHAQVSGREGFSSGLTTTAMAGLATSKLVLAKLHSSAKGFSANVKQKLADAEARTLEKRKLAAEEAKAQRELENPSVPRSPFAASQENRRAEISAPSQVTTPTVSARTADPQEAPGSAALNPARRAQDHVPKAKPRLRPSAMPKTDAESELIYQKNSSRQSTARLQEALHPVFGMSGEVSGSSAQRSPKQVNRELSNLRNELKRHVKGKPSRPVYMMSIPAIIGRSIGRVIKISIFILILAILFTGGTGVGVLMGYINTTVPVEMSQLKSGPLTSYMYDLDNNLIAKYTGASNIDRIDIAFEKVKGTYIDEAFIAIEDERFYTNIGIDPKRIGGAIVSALANAGTPTHGGSTITQQTVKLVTGEDDVSAQRKIQEWYKAIQLTQTLTKDEIMGTYLNLVPMGNSYVGIEAAAQGYFNKSSAELTLEESAYLAAIPRGPSLYNPRTESGLRNGLRRQRIVLGNMFDQGMISQAQYRSALNTELKFVEKPPEVSGTSINSYYSEYAKQQVIEDLAAKMDITLQASADIINSKGVTIYAALEPNVQAAIDKNFNDESIYNSNPAQYAESPEKPQLGQVIINNLTGTIAGMGGGTGEKTANLVLNRAVDIERSPGSTLKPLAVYGPAIDQQTVTGATVFMDEKVYLLGPGTEAWPQNFGGSFYGRITVRNAVKLSLNIEAVQVLMTIGSDVAKQYLYELGMDRRTDGVDLALAMGSLDKGMSPLEIASGYAALANNGMYCRPLAYTKVLAHDGTVLLEGKPEYTQVFKPETAFMMTSILRETMLGITSSLGLRGLGAGTIGLISNANGEDIYTVGKSGTTQFDWDRWFSGYSPYYSTSVWYGFDTPIPLTYGTDDYRAPEYVFRNTMREIHANLEPRSFERPATIISLDICNQSGFLANPQCGNNVQTEVFDVNSPLTPKTNCNIHFYRAPAAPAPTTPAATEPAPAPGT